MRQKRLAILLSLGISAACGAPATDASAPWVAPAAAPVPPPEAMYLEMNQGTVLIADGILEDRWPARGFPDAQLTWPLSWTEDPYSDAYFRFMFYSLRNTEHLLFAYQKTNDRRYLDKLVAILDSYVAYDAQRPASPDTFDNAHASAYRAMILTNVYVKLQQLGALSPELESGLRSSLQRLGDFLMAPKSFESYANHGFTEAAALLVIAHNFPALTGAETWRATGIARLEQMRVTNVDPDGVDVENSPFYHMLVLGLAAQISDWASAYEPSIGAAWKDTVRGMLRYLAYVTQPDGTLPMLGATQAWTVRNSDPRIFGPLAALDSDYASIWSGGKGGTPPARRAELFPTSGLFVLRAQPTSPGRRQTFLTFDSGAYRTDHSHLDALSITLYSDGATIFPDSGLFTYDRGADYDYFHGTRAHNTVVVDGKDQAEGAAAPGAYGVAENAPWATGESDLYKGVRHRRTVVLLQQGIVVVADDLSSERSHDYAQLWHLSPDEGLATSGLEASVDDGAGGPLAHIAQADPEGLTSSTAFGQTEPVQGWVSATYGAKVPASVVAYHRTATSTSFVTLLTLGRRAWPGTAARIRQSADPLTHDRVIRVCAYGANETLHLRNEGGADATVEISSGDGC